MTGACLGEQGPTDAACLGRRILPTRGRWGLEIRGGPLRDNSTNFKDEDK